MKTTYQSIIPTNGNFIEDLRKILLYRGFLVEESEGELYLTDNAMLYPDKHWECISDSEFLSRTLKEHGLGQLEKLSSFYKHNRFKIHLNSISRIPDSFQSSLFDDYPIRKETMWFHYQELEKNFGPNSKTRKCPLYILEPKIAFAVKAFSAAGCQTRMSCEGHGEFGGAYVDFIGAKSTNHARFIINTLEERGVKLDHYKFRTQQLHFQKSGFCLGSVI